MRTTLDIPDPLFRELKTQAAQQSIKMKELIRQYIEAGIYGQKSLSKASSRSRSPLPVFRPATGKKIAPLTNREIQNIMDQEDAQRLS